MKVVGMLIGYRLAVRLLRRRTRPSYPSGTVVQLTNHDEVRHSNSDR